MPRVDILMFDTQVKQIGSRASQTLSKIMLALNERTSDTDPQQLDEIGRLALELGVEVSVRPRTRLRARARARARARG